MKTLIIGASGKIGQKLVDQLLAKGDNFRVMARTTEQLENFTNRGIEAVLGDLEGDLSRAFIGCERVIFTAGSGSKTGPHKTLLVDLWGSIRAIEESEKHGIKHFIMVSSLKSDQPLNGPEKIWHYLVARNLADDRLQRSSLTYTLLRPGRLLDTDPTGKVTSKFDWSDTTNSSSVITRDDVVAVITQLLAAAPNFKRNHTIDFINGDIPIADFLAVKEVARAAV